MSQEHDVERRFAKAFFSGSDDDRGEEDQGASEYTDEQRSWAKELFATLDDEDSPILAGLKSGRTAGRWQPATDD